MAVSDLLDIAITGAPNKVSVGPGSFLEVQKILPLLTNPENGVSFHVVAPSLPNFGFSQGPKKAGFGVAQYAEAMHKVMINLGYNKYGKLRSPSLIESL
jgi:pimeloyl-ACP methyl ester carboxylesterase